MSALDPSVDRSGLRWTVHPAAAHPGRAALVGAIILVAGLWTSQVTGSPAFGALGSLALLVSLRAYFLPRHYALDADGAREEGPLYAGRELAWADVRRIASVRFGVHLSPLHSESRLVRDRGLFLRTAGNRDQVLDYAESHRAAP